MEVSGRVVVVTGGGSGIGAALCRAFASAGAAGVIVADINSAGAEAVAREVGGVAVTTDVTDESAVRDLVAFTVGRHGRLDIYCSNAGVAIGGGPEAPDEAWQRSWEVHVMAHVYAARALLPAILERGEGYFLGTVSAAGLVNHVAAAPYAVTKAAGLSFLEWLAIAHGAQGLRVSALCPQGVRTPMLALAGEKDFLFAGALEADDVAACVLLGMADERFLILPHPEVREYFGRKASDYDRWLRGMQRLREHVVASATTR
jgi:NAD(P)-dependent dehydrogenase (short-subunit alcohol dehydrogenase family)